MGSWGTAADVSSLFAPGNFTKLDGAELSSATSAHYTTPVFSYRSSCILALHLDALIPF